MVLFWIDFESEGRPCTISAYANTEHEAVTWAASCVGANFRLSGVRQEPVQGRYRYHVAFRTQKALRLLHLYADNDDTAWARIQDLHQGLKSSIQLLKREEVFTGIRGV